MPLPRYFRLPESQREHILSVARASFATDGVDRASYNAIIDKAGISKTSAYQYFDSRSDLLGAVIADLIKNATSALGPWSVAPDPQAFWVQLDAASSRLLSYIATNPDAGAILAQQPQGAGPDPGWLRKVIENGIDLEMIRIDLDQQLLFTATAKMFEAIDDWALRGLTRGAEKPPAVSDLTDAWHLLARLWGTPDDKRLSTASGATRG